MAAMSFTVGTTVIKLTCAGAFSKGFLLGSAVPTVRTPIRACLRVRGGGNSPITSRLGLATVILTAFLTFLQIYASDPSFRVIFLNSQLLALPQQSYFATITIERLQRMNSAGCSTL